MIILDSHRKIKKAAKFAGMFALVAVVLVLVFWGAKKLQTRYWSASPAPEQAKKTSAQKQKEMLDAINRTNSQNESISQEEKEKRQREMLKAINEANQK